MVNVAEEWRSVPGFEFYEASNHGRVRSVERVVQQESRWGTLMNRRWPQRVLSPIDHRGYLVVKLGGPNKAYGVHQAVAMAWIGPKPEGMVVNHINGIKHDNRPENLEYTTNTDNVLHAYRTGLLSNVGETNGNHRTNRMKRQTSLA